MAIDVSESNVYVSTSASGPFSALVDATGYALTSGSEGETTVRTFGGGRYVRAGDDADTYSIDALFDRDGQQIMRTAKKNKTSVWIAIIQDDTLASEEGFLQECKVTEFTIEAQADGDFVRASFSATGEGELTEITELPS